MIDSRLDYFEGFIVLIFIDLDILLGGTSSDLVHEAFRKMPLWSLLVTSYTSCFPAVWYAIATITLRAYNWLISKKQRLQLRGTQACDILLCCVAGTIAGGYALFCADQVTHVSQKQVITLSFACGIQILLLMLLRFICLVYHQCSEQNLPLYKMWLITTKQYIHTVASQSKQEQCFREMQSSICIRTANKWRKDKEMGGIEGKALPRQIQKESEFLFIGASMML